MPASLSPGTTRRHFPDVRPEFVALGFLMASPLHGYDLFRRFEADLGKVWHISQSQMYSILKRLELQGLIASNIEAGEKSQERRILNATDQGVAHFSQWLAAPSDCSSRIIRLEFISRLYFARGWRPESVLAIIEAQRATIARQLRNHQALLASTPAQETWNRLGIELRLSQLSGIAAWLETSVAVLNQAL